MEAIVDAVLSKNPNARLCISAIALETLSAAVAALTAHGLTVFDTLQKNDAYHALQAADGLILTGPTGTNVNDVAVALVAGD